MTRRILVYKENDRYYVSQEFNGDKVEMQKLRESENVPLKSNWEEIITLFDGVKNLNDFKECVKIAEVKFTYDNEDLFEMNEIPRCEEVWMIINNKLKLYSTYGEEI
ncbi:hypothetical protein [Clostridioides difficile]|uniref:hypothetical protein n=1 Tax=Clostridioides difficile TaxID=1496 RepID=UPI000CF2D119|nr:hypothetical protein [Clostridioides difficile]MDC0804832.1 hypothetical protein [Clostridium paraputrificum]AWH83429.1 hypothetical protein DDG63_20560 [Clostridioides difficile]EGT5015179.1 hypothetical protein [Clostridioides difficile]EGT5086636.1 hypothetical protein [Clostridioides difficile]EIS9354832.1 hypothetical protein [Clostridioides difficile]